MHKFFLIFLLCLLTFPVFSGELEVLVPSSGRLTLDQTKSLLDLSRRNSWNAFDLLSELGKNLQTRGLRIEIQGQDLRKAGETYRLGDHRVFAILPLDKLTRISLGYTQNPDKIPALEVWLKETHGSFLELGDFSLQTYYGFRRLEGKALDGSFGATVKNGPLTLNLEKIERVPDPTGGNNPNFIAIHVQMFFRPKRWHIDPIRLWLPEESREDK